MKNRKILFGIFIVFLSAISFISCSNEVQFDNDTETIKIFVSAQTGFYKSGDITEDVPIEGMKIKESEKNDWDVVPFNKISNFIYEKGYDYELLVEKTTSTNPGNIRYKLIKLLNKQKETGNIKIIELHISAQTGLYKDGDLTQEIPSIEGMKIKEGEENDWYVVPFNKITGFEYEKGYSYKLLVERTTLIDMPIYINKTTYKLIKILSREKSE